MSSLQRLWGFTLVCLILLSFPSSRNAQAGSLTQVSLTVLRNEIELDFPNRLTFNLEARAPAEIQKVYLDYGTQGRSCRQGTSRQVVEIDPGTQITASWEWDFIQRGHFPPGVEIWWEWEIVLSSGESLFTERMNYTYEDPGFTWQNLTDERITFVWTEGDSSFGEQLFQISTDSLDRLEEEFGIQMPEKIRITVYPDSSDIHAAMPHLPEWSGGIANAQFNLVLAAIPPDAFEWANSVIPHEIAHLVVGMRTFNCLGIDLPKWLSEGIAELAEQDMTAEEEQLLIDKLSQGELPGLITLAGSFSANPDEARLSYTQSAAAVSYLIETFGPEKFDELLSVMQQGKNANRALLQVYGLDTAGLDQAWRASLGFESQPQQEKTATLPPTQIPTLALWTAAVNLTATPTVTSQPSLTPTALPVSATPQPTEPDLNPTATAAPDPGSPLPCLSGLLFVLIGLPGLLLFWIYVLRIIRT
jgi:hypothetical protein